MTEVLDYDVMGNILSLNRDGTGVKTYSYTGNQLQSVSGLTGTYVYDANGNATTDGRNGVTISYNHLSLPTTASKSGLNLTYTYDATGAKLRKVSTTGATTTTDYVGGIQYTNNVIDFIQTEEGIARNSNGTYTYEYNLNDHLGNVRATFKVNGSTVEVLQRDNYYAFGMRKSALNDIGAVSLQNKYLYNGKELQEELEQYDYGARFYDPVIGRWNVVDPHAINYKRLSPYNYVNNNPINSIDPDGRDLIVLSASKQVGGLGHAAVLIGNKETGYDLYSKNGTYGSSGASGASDKNPVIARHFDTIEEFIGSKDNIAENGKNLYTEGYEIKTDEATDMKMRDAAKNAVLSDYNVLSSSCIDVASDALNAGGLNPGLTSFRGRGPLPSQRHGYGGIVSVVPNRRYNDIKKWNPQGNIIFNYIPTSESNRKPIVEIGKISNPEVLDDKIN